MVARLLTRTVGLRRNGQQVQFHRRERRKSIFDPAFELNQTHTFPLGTTSIDTDTRFPATNRLRPITFRLKIKRTGASPNGIILDLGDATTGFTIWANGTQIGIAAGSAGSQGISVLTGDVLNAVDQELRLTGIAIPGYGVAALYTNDDLTAFGVAPAQRFPNGWANGSLGAIGAPNVEVNSAVPPANAVPLQDVSIIENVRGFVGQYPRQLSIRLPERINRALGSFSSSFSRSFSGGV